MGRVQLRGKAEEIRDNSLQKAAMKRKESVLQAKDEEGRSKWLIP